MTDDDYQEQLPEEQPLEEQPLEEQPMEEQPLEGQEEQLPQAAVTLTVPAATEGSDLDARERVEFEEFVRKGCCEGKCHLQFDEGYLRSVRWEMAELTKEELDMVIMSQLMVCSGTDELTSANKKVAHERQRNITEYRHKNKKVKLKKQHTKIIQCLINFLHT